MFIQIPIIFFFDSVLSFCFFCVNKSKIQFIFSKENVWDSLKVVMRWCDDAVIHAFETWIQATIKFFLCHISFIHIRLWVMSDGWCRAVTVLAGADKICRHTDRFSWHHTRGGDIFSTKMKQMIEIRTGATVLQCV